jgi:hypothetical protein
MSPDEKKLYLVLLKRKVSWRYQRWGIITSGVIILAFGVILLCQMGEWTRDYEFWRHQIVPFMTVITISGGSAMCFITLAQWRGDPAVDLLLELTRRDDEKRK